MSWRSVACVLGSLSVGQFKFLHLFCELPYLRLARSGCGLECERPFRDGRLEHPQGRLREGELEVEEEHDEPDYDDIHEDLVNDST